MIGLTEKRVAFDKLMARSPPAIELPASFAWSEGPAWLEDEGHFIFSDVRNDRLYRVSLDGQVSIFREVAGYPNGNHVDTGGALLTCETTKRRVVRRSPDGEVEVIASHFKGRRFSSPNDVTSRSDGTVFFTDPHYGFVGQYPMEGERELDVNGVYAVEPSGTISRIFDSFEMPNGLAFSPDEKQLYVADSSASHFAPGRRHVRRFQAAGSLSFTELFPAIEIPCGVPDGLRCDRDGLIWISAGDGVYCYTEEGELVGHLPTPCVVTNLCFGGEALDVLLITAGKRAFLKSLRSMPFD